MWYLLLACLVASGGAAEKKTPETLIDAAAAEGSPKELIMLEIEPLAVRRADKRSPDPAPQYGPQSAQAVYGASPGQFLVRSRDQGEPDVPAEYLGLLQQLVAQQAAQQQAAQGPTSAPSSTHAPPVIQQLVIARDPEPSAVRYSSPVDPSQLLALEGLSPTPAPTPAPRRPQPPYARLQQQLQQTYSDQRTQQQFQTPRRPPPPTPTPASAAYAQLAPASAHRLHESRLRAALAGDNPNYASEALAQQQLLRSQSTPTPAPEYYQGGDDAVFQQQLTRLVAQAQQEAQLSQQQEAQLSQQQEAQLSRQQEAQLAQQQAVQLSQQQEAQLSRQQDAQLSQQQEAQLAQQQVAQDEQAQLQQLIQTQSVQPQSFPQPRPQQPTPLRQQQQYLSSPPSSAQYQPVYAQQEASVPTGRQVASTTAPIYVPSYPEPQQQQQSPPAQYLRETIHPRSRRPQQSVVQIPRQPSRQALTESDPGLYQARQPQRTQQQDDDFLSSLLEQPGRGLFNKPSQSTLDIIQSTTALPPSRSSIFVSTTSNLEGRKNSGVTVEEVGSVPQDEGKAIPEVRLPTPQGQRPLTQSEFQALISAGFKVSPIGQETDPPSPVTYTSQEAYESQAPASVRYQPQPPVLRSYQPQPPALDNYQPQAPAIDNYQPQAQAYYQSSPKRQRSYSTPTPPRKNEVIYEQKAPQQQVYQDADYDVPSASPAQLAVPQGQQVQRLSPIVVPDQPEQGEASTQDQPRRKPSGSRRSQYSRSRSSYRPQRPQEVSGENQQTYATYDAVPESTNYSARSVRPRGRRPTPSYESS